MMNKKLLCTGAAGTVIAALCCFTPVLAVLFGAAGLTAWLAKADYVIMPAMIFFVLLTGYAIYRRRQGSDAACDTPNMSQSNERSTGR